MTTMYLCVNTMNSIATSNNHAFTSVSSASPLEATSASEMMLLMDHADASVPGKSINYGKYWEVDSFEWVFSTFDQDDTIDSGILACARIATGNHYDMFPTDGVCIRSGCKTIPAIPHCRHGVLVVWHRWNRREHSSQELNPSYCVFHC